MKRDKEIRQMIFDVRAGQDDERGVYLEGIAIVYGQVIQYGWRREVIDAGAIDAATDLKDVRFLIGHNTSMVPLARSRNNNANSTMQLIPVENGLKVRIYLDIENNQDARTLYSAVKRGSFIICRLNLVQRYK